MKKSELYEDIYGDNFSFGKNWQNFLKGLDDTKIEAAKKYLVHFIGGQEKIVEKDIIDFGSGSGLMSLCYVLLGAKKVVSIDIDDASIACTEFLRKKYKISEDKWEIRKGSVLDKEFVMTLGQFDIVYSWGVIHHSGDMWSGLANIISIVREKGYLYVAIYNDSKVLLEGTSPFWVKTKRLYSSSHLLRPFMKGIYTTYLILGLLVYGKNPISYIKNYRENALRGMDFFIDIEDWLGGYPYEYASYEEMSDFYTRKGFSLVKGVRVRSIACNEFLFQKS
ncbi:class I SAM-dependent methyltransferase [Candidatus Gracilibacteria bacterium]|nr:class I SAM-dependent methyltransferase [Candidatus Gracilibacteria bacterium]